MSNWQLSLFIFVIAERLLELVIARRNAIWAAAQGGYEVGRQHYPLFIVLHCLFLLGIWWEAGPAPTWWMIPFIGFACAGVLRIWAITSLGRYWNTRIWVVPGHTPQVCGPYQYLRHPNYLVVIIELITLPLLYQAYVTMISITILNAALLLKIRIPAEEQALREVTTYELHMGDKGRLVPGRK